MSVLILELKYWDYRVNNPCDPKTLFVLYIFLQLLPVQHEYRCTTAWASGWEQKFYKYAYKAARKIIPTLILKKKSINLKFTSGWNFSTLILWHLLIVKSTFAIFILKVSNKWNVKIFEYFHILILINRAISKKYHPKIEENFSQKWASDQVTCVFF